jgi:hypothetical protein
LPTDQARVYRAEVLVAELKPTFSPVDKASKDLRHNPVRQAADEQGAFVAGSFEKHNDFRIARKFSDESFYRILIDGLYIFFPELRIVTFAFPRELDHRQPRALNLA